MYAKRTDVNQRIIVETFRSMGATVIDTSSLGKGFPDLVVGYRNQTLLVEIKKDNKAKFTVQQLEFLTKWNGGTVARIENQEQAIKLLSLLPPLLSEKIPS